MCESGMMDEGGGVFSPFCYDTRTCKNLKMRRSLSYYDIICNRADQF